MYGFFVYPIVAPWVFWLTWLGSLTPVRMGSSSPPPSAPPKPWPSYGPDFDIPHFYKSSEEIIASYNPQI